jgi:hypothetical protein
LVWEKRKFFLCALRLYFAVKIFSSKCRKSMDTLRGVQLASRLGFIESENGFPHWSDR